MANITTRAGKGSPLTYDEVDGNFTSLNNAKLETNVVSTDGLFTSNSDALVPSQKAAKTYIDTKFAGGVTSFNGRTGTIILNYADVTSALNPTPLDVPHGGTGLSTLNPNYLYKGNGAGALAQSLVYDNGTNVSLVSGNLNFSGTGQRITGDMSNGTLTSRVAFQTTTANSTTNVHAIPNGTATGAGFKAESDPTFANGQFAALDVVGGSDVRISSDIRGTGTYLPLTFYTGGGERLRIDTSGNVGIGTTAPGGIRLNISTPGASSGETGLVINNPNTSAYATIYTSYYTAGGNRAQVTAQQAASTSGGVLILSTANSSGTITEALRIDSGQNVGIGTSSPGAKLDVNGNVNTSTGYQFGSDSDLLYQSAANTATLRVGTSTNQTYFGFRAVGGFPILDGPAGILGLSTSGLERLHIDSSGNAQLGSANATAAAGVRYFDVYNLENTNSSSASNIRAITQNAAGTGAVSVDIIKYKSGLFSITNNETSAGSAITLGTVGTERMRIDSGGNVGIGVSSPSVYGHLVAQGAFAGTSNSNLSLLTTGAAQGEQADIALYSTFQGTADNSPRRTADIIAGFNGGAWGNEYLTFNVGNGGAGNDTRVVTSEKMRITSAGYVGIATSTPTTQLHIKGSGANTASGIKLEYTGTSQFGSQPLQFKNNVSTTNQQAAWIYTSVEDTANTTSAFNISQFSGTGAFVQNLTAYSMSGNYWQFFTAGSERARIDSSGNFSVGTTGGDFGRSFRGVFRQDQNATTQVGVINATIGASAVARYSRIGGTGNSFCDWDLVDGNGSPYDLYSYGSAVGSTVWSYASTERMRLTSAGKLGIATPTPSTHLQVNGSVGYNAPVSITAATYTVAATDNWLIANFAGTVTLTLPAASSFTGRIITVKNVQAQTVVSASSNVVPIGSTTAGTAILAATAGKFATLVSDGTNWIVMQAN